MNPKFLKGFEQVFLDEQNGKSMVKFLSSRKKLEFFSQVSE